MQTIVVPTDFSEYANHAVQLGVELGRLTGAKVDIIHSVPTYIDWAYLPKDKEKEYGEMKHVINLAKSRLKAIVDNPAYGDVELAQHLYYEAGHEAILKHVEDIGADLLIMGTHGHSGFSKYFLGSTTEKAIRLVNCPVITVKEQASADALKKLLFVSDFEEDVAGVFSKVKHFSDRIGGTVDLLTVLTPLAESNQPVDTEHFQKLAQEDYQSAHTIHIHTYQTVEDGVVSFVEEQNYGAVAMGTHARKGVMRLLHWGSIAERLANQASFPVITVRM